MYLAIKHYFETGIYLNSRKEIAKAIDEPILKDVLDTLNSIDNKTKDEIITTASSLLTFLS